LASFVELINYLRQFQQKEVSEAKDNRLPYSVIYYIVFGNFRSTMCNEITDIAFDNRLFQTRRSLRSTLSNEIIDYPVSGNVEQRRT